MASSTSFRAVYSLASLGFSSKMAMTGAGLCLGAVCVSDEQKKTLNGHYVTLMRRLGVEGHIPDSDLQSIYENTALNTKNILLASPFFYGAFHAFLGRKLPFIHHMAQASLKGISGTFASTLPLALLYGMAAVVLPVAQNALMKQGYEKKVAREMSEGITFLGAAAVPELLVELYGCGVSPRNLTLATGAFGASCVALRLAAGVLTQFRASSSKNSSEMEDLCVTLAGTTLAQHSLNATTKAAGSQLGMKGVVNYLKTGDVLGAGSPKQAAARFAGTFGQRVLFSATWNHLNHRREPLIVETVSETKATHEA